MSIPDGLLFLIFLHGFKGNDKTFEDFPQRVCYTLSHTYGSKYKVEGIVYPQYKTAGKLEDAVMNFLSWLQSHVAEKENDLLEEQNKDRQEKLQWADRSQAKIVLLAHSMGGLVAADVCRLSMKAHEEADPTLSIWPQIKAVLAYDTPYLGLNPGTFQNTADQYIKHATDAHDLFSSLTGVSIASIWGAKAKQEANKSTSSTSAFRKESAVASSSSSPPSSESASWLNLKTAASAVGGTAAAAGLAALAWNQRQQLTAVGTNSWDFVNSHFEFVGALFKPTQLSERLNELCQAGDVSRFPNRIRFHCFYTLIPTKERSKPKRTFINLPAEKTPQREKFTANPNSAASNEIDAHCSMFGTQNAGSHQLALETTRLITAWIE